MIERCPQVHYTVFRICSLPRLFGHLAGAAAVMAACQTALAGTIGCAIAMVKIDETYALVSMAIAAALYFWLRGRTTGGRGLLSVLDVSADPGESLDKRLDERHRHILRIQQQLHEKGVVAFADSVVVPDAGAVPAIIDRLDAIIQAYSIGSLRPNTVMMSLPPPLQPERRARVADMLAVVASFGLNVVLYKGARVDGSKRKLIDVWWHGQRNGSLLALFADLTQSHPDRNKAEIRMLRVVTSGPEHLEAEKSLTEMMAAARLAVHVEVVLSQRPVSEIIAERSAAADLVLLGMRSDDVRDLHGLLGSRDELLTGLPPTLLVLSNGEADLLA